MSSTAPSATSAIGAAVVPGTLRQSPASSPLPSPSPSSEAIPTTPVPSSSTAESTSQPSSATSSPEQHRRSIPTMPSRYARNKKIEKVKTVGEYIISKKIGSGATSKVVLGVHYGFGEQVAIKKINKNKFQKDLHTLTREVDILRNINHPNVVKLIQVTETEKNLNLVLEYCEGGDLHDYISIRRHLTEKDARAIFRQLVSAVGYCHLQGIAHRDLKPENILLDGSPPRVKLIDFGLAHQSTGGKECMLTTFCGTPEYAAPEVLLRGQNAYDGKKADIWSMGVILFSMATGTLPFAPGFHRDYHLTFNPPFVSGDLQDLISNILVADPHMRFTLQQIQYHRWLRIGYMLPPSFHPIASSVPDILAPSSEKLGFALNGVKASNALSASVSAPNELQSHHRSREELPRDMVPSNSQVQAQSADQKQSLPSQNGVPSPVPPLALPQSDGAHDLSSSLSSQSETSPLPSPRPDLSSPPLSSTPSLPIGILQTNAEIMATATTNNLASVAQDRKRRNSVCTANISPSRKSYEYLKNSVHALFTPSRSTKHAHNSDTNKQDPENQNEKHNDLLVGLHFEWPRDPTKPITLAVKTSDINTVTAVTLTQAQTLLNAIKTIGINLDNSEDGKAVSSPHLRPLSLPSPTSIPSLLRMNSTPGVFPRAVGNRKSSELSSTLLPITEELTPQGSKHTKKYDRKDKRTMSWSSFLKPASSPLPSITAITASNGAVINMLSCTKRLSITSSKLTQELVMEVDRVLLKNGITFVRNGLTFKKCSYIISDQPLPSGKKKVVMQIQVTAEPAGIVVKKIKGDDKEFSNLVASLFSQMAL